MATPLHTGSTPENSGSAQTSGSTVPRTRSEEFKQGWATLLSVTVGSAVGVTALLFYSLGAFTGPLVEEFGWTRAQVSSSFLYTTVALTIATVPLGWLLDKVGPRRVALVSAPGLSLSLLLLAMSSGDLLQFHLLFALAGLLGAGTSSVVYTKALNSRFFLARGMALGISLGGLGLAALVLPIMVTAVIEPFGWRAGFLLLAGLSILVIPFAVAGMKDHPLTSRNNHRQLSGLSRREALRSRTFWILVLTFVLVGGSVPALIPHLVPLLTDSGLSPTQAAGIAGMVGIGVILGRLLVGLLIDHFHAPFVTAPLFLLTAFGVLLLAWGGPEFAPVTALLLGLSFGAEADLIAFFCGHHFGLRNYGFLYAIVYGVFNLAVGFGPLWVGSIFDSAGSYQPALVTVAAMLGLGAATICLVPRASFNAPSAPATAKADDNSPETLGQAVPS